MQVNACGTQVSKARLDLTRPGVLLLYSRLYSPPDRVTSPPQPVQGIIWAVRTAPQPCTPTAKASAPSLRSAGQTGQKPSCFCLSE